MSDHDAANGRTGTGKPGVVAVATSPLGVLIGRRADGRPPWAFIGGKIEPGETAAEAAVQEVLDEPDWRSTPSSMA